MANIYITKDAFYFTSAAASTTDYRQFANSGYGITGFKVEWTGSYLTYTPGTVFPTGGTLTSVSASKLNGEPLYSASQFSLNLSTVPPNTGVDILIYNYIGQLGSNYIQGSIYDDSLLATRNGDSVYGGLGNDTLIIFGNYSGFQISNINTGNSSATIKDLSDGSSAFITSVEYLKFSDKTVKLSDLAVSSYSLSSNSSSINEGAIANFILATQNVAAGTIISYSISGVSSSDLSLGTLTGSVSVSSTGTTNITLPIASDNLTEGTENLTLTLQGKSASIQINDTSKSPPTYLLSSNITSVNEGATVLFTLKTTNITSGTSVTYTLSGISAADISGGSLSGNAVVNSSGDATISVTLLNDLRTEGAETLTVTAGEATASTLINDTSKASTSPTYSIAATNSSFNEGSTASFTLITTNVAAGTSVPYTISGISAADVSGGSLSGSTAVASNGQATISVLLANDNLTEGTETLTITAGGASASAQINDTSKSTTSGFPTLLTLQEMQASPALPFDPYSTTSPGISWNFLGSYYGTNFLGQDVNLASFNGLASSVYDFFALSIDDPKYLAIFDSSGSIIKTSQESSDYSAFVDNSGQSFDRDNISFWSPPVDGTYYLAVVLSQTIPQPFYSFGIYETRSSKTTLKINGGSSNDTLNSTASNDVINGGSGIDAVVVNGKIANYSVVETVTGFKLTDNSGITGTDALSNIESIKFSDKSMNLMVQSKAANTAPDSVTSLVELYVSFFNRIPDADGMSFWLDEIKAGKTINQIADSFYAAGVNYSDLTGFSSQTTNTDFINVIYKNVLGRSGGADSGGLTFWNNELTSGRATKGTLVTDILKSAHTFKGDPTWGWVANLLDNKIEVAKKFSIDLGLNFNTPEESIKQGMSIASAITPSDTKTALALVSAPSVTLIPDTTPKIFLSPSSTSVNEGGLATVFVSTRNVAANTSLSFSISGVDTFSNVTASRPQWDVKSLLTSTIILDSNGQGVLNIQTNADNLTEGSETMYLTVGNSTTSIIIKDTSITLVGVDTPPVVDAGGG